MILFFARVLLVINIIDKSIEFIDQFLPNTPTFKCKGLFHILLLLIMRIRMIK